MLPELIALDGHRLDRNWTWTLLAAHMAGAGQAIPMRTLHYLCKRAPVGHHPLDRTMHKIRRYLAFAQVETPSPVPPPAVKRPAKKKRRGR